MVRKLSLAIALALGLTPISASALGLGDIKAKSSLNQQFNADIELLSVSTEEISDIKVILASEEVFAKAGLNRPYFLSQLKFTPVRLASGKGIVRVTTSEPVREPFLNFLIEVNWPKGRLYREYTVLLDPPATLQRAPAPVQAARTAPRRAPKPAPAAAPPASAGTGQYGPTRRNDTLWNIAKEVRHGGTTMEQMVMALFQANPQAFDRQNINNLRVGQILRVPERDEVLAMTAREARAEFWEQVNNWRAKRDVAVAGQSVDDSDRPAADSPQPASEAAAQAGAEAVTPEPEAELKIARTQAGDESGARTGDSADADGAPSELQQELIEAREMRESALEESNELKGRVESLASQLEDLQRLLELKDEQLARLQVALGDNPDTDAAVEAVATPDVSEAAAPQTDGADAGVAEEAAATDTGSEDGSVAAEPTVTDEAATPAPETMATGDQAEPDPVAEEVGQPDTVVEPLAEDGEPKPEMAMEAPKPEPEPEPAPKPEPIQPAAPAKPATPPTFVEQITGHPLVKKFIGDPMMMGIGAGVVILLLALIWLLFGRKRKVEEVFQESILVDTADNAPAMVDGHEVETADSDASVSEETSFLSDFSPSEIDSLPDDTGEVDPLAEADVYIAYGRYGQAENLVRQGLERTPDNQALKLKLFEILFATKNAPAFAQLAQETASSGLPSTDPGAWESIATMGAKLVPGNALFDSKVTGVAAGGDAMDALDDLDLDDLSASLEMDKEVRETLDQAQEAKPPHQHATEAAPESLESELDLDFDSLEGDDGLDLKSIAQDLIADDSQESTSLTQDTEELEGLPPLELDDIAESEEAYSLDDVADEAPAEPPSEALEERLELPDLDALSDDLESPAAEAGEAGSDEINTKLDLARAYVDMGDEEGAKSILQEVVSEGSAQQQAQARRMLDGFA
jgi:pilus assembly protein FimV